MAGEQYYSVFTEQGLALLREAIQNGSKLGITHMAFGDGGGNTPNPDASFTRLVNEVYRTQLNSLSPDPNNSNWLRAEAVIASAVGGFNIRELGLWAGDVLVAYSNYPATYKPNPADGTARIMTFRMILQIDNTANFELKIDADIVMATIRAVEEAKIQAFEHAENLVKQQVRYVDSLDLLSELDDPIEGQVVYVKNIGEYEFVNNIWTPKTREASSISAINNKTQDWLNKQWIEISPHLVDDPTLDTLKIKELIELAKTQKKGIRCSPRDPIKVNDDIDFSGINHIDMRAHIQVPSDPQNEKTITWGGTAISGANARIHFMNVENGTSGKPLKPTFRIFGAKQAEITIGACNHFQLYADGEVSIRNSVAYNQIQFTGIIRKITITDSGKGVGWVNENTMRGGRLVDISIIGVAYSHNHNKFERNCIEGSTASIYMERAWENRITDARFEGVPEGFINFGEATFCNHIVGSWVGSGSLRGYFNNSRVGTDLGRGNMVAIDMVAFYEQIPLFSMSTLNTEFIGTANKNYLSVEQYKQVGVRDIGNININKNEFTFPAWSSVFNTELIPVDKNTVLSIATDSEDTSYRINIEVYDKNKQKIIPNAANPHVQYAGQSVSGDSYTVGADQHKVPLRNGFSVDRDEVKYVRILLISGSKSAKFKSLILYCYRQKNSRSAMVETYLKQRPFIPLIEGPITKFLGNTGFKAIDKSAGKEVTCIFSKKINVTTNSEPASTTLEIEDSTEIVPNDLIGIELEDGEFQWSSINAVNGNTLTLNDALSKRVLTSSPVYVSRFI